ncbi:unnamed protein product [Trifolium pratense]|uniref:Uncharacterized protein n=1 Tax=Trifolium pratense TaxID=57577 RepID=A0ACB0L042_TRIPR|nr:unnamed protein product [Trifolium pratense]
MDKEGGFVTRPPLLVGASNYDYWKSRMMAFLKQIDSKTWKAVLRGWTPPVKMDKDGKPTFELKSAEEWSKEEDELALANSKALYALYNGVDKHIFRLIKKCVSAKEAWTILETVHEGTSKVKLSKLQLLTTKFENLRMNDDETIQDFHMTILDFDNQFDALGEKIPEEKLVRKMLRSLPKKFDMKVTAIEEAKDITDMKLDELVGSLQTYEVATNEKMDKKNKSIAFVSNAEEEDQQSDTESENSISDAMVLLRKQFNKVLKIMDKRPKTSAADIGRNTYRNFRKPVTEEKSAPNKGVQCHECEGYGHIRTECATFLKKQKKGLTVSWSDEDSEGETDTAKSIHALTGVCTSDTESCDEELTFDELAESYKELCLRSEEVCRISEKQKETISKLQTERIVNLTKISEIGVKCEEGLKTIEEQKAIIANLETDKLEQLAEISKLNEEVDVTNTKGCAAESCEKSLIAHTSLRASSKEDWYFDSGCSKHMTGVEKYLMDIKSYATSFVTFGDGAKGEIKGIGRLIDNGLPKLENVLIVKGLTANLISIRQLCDQGMQVNFTKNECLVTNDEGDILMKGVRSKDNCYLWVPLEEANVSTCLLTKEDEVKLWHQKLGHLNLKSMKRAISEEAIRGLPNLQIQEDNICGECQIGKQTKVSHQKLQHLSTSRVLELLHMDLMGPMQVESLGGKKYAFVVVDDFSRYTWVNFIRQKSETFDEFKDLCLQLQKENDCGILRIRSDHGKEFENSKFAEFCAAEGIAHEFSSPITPQQNGVVERKNRTLQESVRVMLHAKNLPYKFWAEAMNTSCYIHNRVTLRTGTATTLCELWKNRKPTVKYFHVFRSKCYILADREPRRKLDPKSDEGIFLGYSTNNRAYRVFNSRTKTMMESINVVIDDTDLTSIDSAEETDVVTPVPTPDDDQAEYDSIQDFEPNTENLRLNKGPSIRVQKNHSKEISIRNPDQGVTIRISTYKKAHVFNVIQKAAKP